MPNDKKPGLSDPPPPGFYGYVIRLLGWVLEAGVGVGLGGGQKEEALMLVWRSHVVNQIYKWQWNGAGL